MGLSLQKPIRRAYEQNPEAVARWLAEEYPAIQARAAKDKAIGGASNRFSPPRVVPPSPST